MVFFQTKFASVIRPQYELKTWSLKTNIGLRVLLSRRAGAELEPSSEKKNKEFNKKFFYETKLLERTNINFNETLARILLHTFHDI
jgi:hypothetical protein